MGTMRGKFLFGSFIQNKSTAEFFCDEGDSAKVSTSKNLESSSKTRPWQSPKQDRSAVPFLQYRGLLS
jgi:hypothetical protein